MLKELYELYNRLLAQGESLPVEGRSSQKTSFCVVLREDGSIVRIESLLKEIVTEKKNKKGQITTSSKFVAHPRMMLGKGRPPVAVYPCFLFDNAAYLFGYVDESKWSDEAKLKKEIALNKLRFEESRRRHLAMEQKINSVAYSAVCRFFEQWDLSQAVEKLEQLVPDKSIFAGNGIFQLQLSEGYVHQEACIQAAWDAEIRAEWEGSDAEPQLESNCLVTGKYTSIARLHEPSIKGYKGDKGLGAKLVSFKCSAFESYGKSQGSNAPVSKAAAFAYCNALNYLISKKGNRQFLGDTSIVFWTDAPQKEESDLMQLFASAALSSSVEDLEQTEAMDEHMLKGIKHSLQKMAAGYPTEDIVPNPHTRFFILGLAPNVARLSIRFYEESSMGEFVSKVQQHYLDMRMQRRHGKFNDPELITPFMILRQTARDLDNLPAPYAAALMKAIINNTPYPDTIAQAILRRIKVDKDVNYVRVAFLKAWLIRSPRNLNQIKPNIMLDKNNTEIGYVLGRLFATMHKIQIDANPGVELNRSIMDAYFGGASTAPQSVFPRLLKLKVAHLKKIKRDKPQLDSYYEVLIGEILAKLGANSYPKYLSLEQQGLFGIAYYHQIQEFYTSKEDKQKMKENN